MSKFLKGSIIIILTLALGLGSLMATGGIYDAYKQTFGDARWHTKLNNFIDAVGGDISDITTRITAEVSALNLRITGVVSDLSGSISALSTLVTNWVIEDNIVTMVTAAPTYVDGDTFTLPGDYTTRFPTSAVVQIQVAAGMAYSTVASSSYGGGTTTVNLNDSVLTNPITRVYVVATRDGLWPNGPGYVVARDYGVPGRQALVDAIAAIAASERTLAVSPGTWTIDDNLTVPANITLKPERGAIFAIATGKTLTINGGLDAPPYQIISWAGTGKVDFSGSRSVSVAYPQWFGAKGDGATDDTAAIQAALYSNAKVVRFTGSTFLAETTLYWDVSKCAVQMEGGKIDATRNSGTCMVAYTSNPVESSEYPNSKLINFGLELEGDVGTYPNSIGLSLGEYNTNHMANINLQSWAIHGFGKQMSINQWYAYSANYDSCNFYGGTYGIYCGVAGELNKLTNCSIFQNTIGLYNLGGAWLLQGGSYDHNIKAIHNQDGGNINAIGIHLECDLDTDYWIYNSGSTSIITQTKGHVVNSSATPKTMHYAACVNDADGGIHLDGVRFSGFNTSAYTPTYLISSTGQTGITARNLLAYVLNDLTHGYLVAEALNCLSDGGFEGSLTDWTLIDVAPTLVGGVFHGGSKSCKIQPTVGLTSGLKRLIPCGPGDKIRLTYWILNNFGTSADVLYVWIGYADYSGTLLAYGAHEISYSLAGSHYAVWTQQWLQPYTPAPPGAAFMVVRFLTSGSDGGSVNYLDDVAIGVW